eukprot:CAMPEP_0197861768 /NCGR_PEP_ID=MMETSP1438-20131217/38037_1 /TAXON_ID=1461541 /ORGANISM="Pterosperma sp., Strain CCMP1384" /LENGTH=146 /DNA_ID=CAMNT_0043479063 /DNA_START=114 /DNA_END=550 /DNA_ORIENTATION=+
MDYTFDLFDIPPPVDPVEQGLHTHKRPRAEMEADMAISIDDVFHELDYGPDASAGEFGGFDIPAPEACTPIPLGGPLAPQGGLLATQAKPLEPLEPEAGALSMSNAFHQIVAQAHRQSVSPGHSGGPGSTVSCLSNASPVTSGGAG